MTSSFLPVSGVWLPLITPFLKDEVDFKSLETLTRLYLAKPITGFVVGGTTGEGLSLNWNEKEMIVECLQDVQDETQTRKPVFLGLTHTSTRALLRDIDRAADLGVDGYLISAPYYTKPSREGIKSFFIEAARAATKPILIYNHPARTGVNIDNALMVELAQQPLLVGVKNCCSDDVQTLDLIERKPDGFSVLTGTDLSFRRDLGHGGDGGILASAHLGADLFTDIVAQEKASRGSSSSQRWDSFAPFIDFVFSLNNPSLIKTGLKEKGLIASDEVRAPLQATPPALRDKMREWIHRLSL